MPGYSQFVAWSSEDSQYVATCPELGHLTALADTEEDAVRELKVAIDLVLEDMAETGEIPPARYDFASHSGQFRVRLPRTLHARLAWQAKIEGVSLNTLVCSLLSEASSQLTAAGYLSSRFASTYHGVVADARGDGKP
ncbi:MAG: toxin-antitoxin system HicB family antitoxin [bacterium]|nr:toxin-antitoxin system HicB family antitoxin [bacterium]